MESNDQTPGASNTSSSNRNPILDRDPLELLDLMKELAEIRTTELNTIYPSLLKTCDEAQTGLMAHHQNTVKNLEGYAKMRAVIEFLGVQELDRQTDLRNHFEEYAKVKTNARNFYDAVSKNFKDLITAAEIMHSLLEKPATSNVSTQTEIITSEKGTSTPRVLYSDINTIYYGDLEEEGAHPSVHDCFSHVSVTDSIILTDEKKKKKNANSDKQFEKSNRQELNRDFQREYEHYVEHEQQRLSQRLEALMKEPIIETPPQSTNNSVSHESLPSISTPKWTEKTAIRVEGSTRIKLKPRKISREHASSNKNFNSSKNTEALPENQPSCSTTRETPPVQTLNEEDIRFISEQQIPSAPSPSVIPIFEELKTERSTSSIDSHEERRRTRSKFNSEKLPDITIKVEGEKRVASSSTECLLPPFKRHEPTAVDEDEQASVDESEKSYHSDRSTNSFQRTRSYRQTRGVEVSHSQMVEIKKRGFLFEKVASSEVRVLYWDHAEESIFDFVVPLIPTVHDLVPRLEFRFIRYLLPRVVCPGFVLGDDFIHENTWKMVCFDLRCSGNLVSAESLNLNNVVIRPTGTRAYTLRWDKSNPTVITNSEVEVTLYGMGPKPASFPIIASVVNSDRNRRFDFNRIILGESFGIEYLVSLTTSPKMNKLYFEDHHRFLYSSTFTPKKYTK